MLDISAFSWEPPPVMYAVLSLVASQCWKLGEFSGELVCGGSIKFTMSRDYENLRTFLTTYLS